MNKFLPLLVTIYLLGFCPESAKASHSMGADLTYRCLGGNTYEITLSFYRDCAGIPADQSATIEFTSSCFTSGFAIINLIPGTGQEITPLCPSQVSTCNGGTFTGVQEYIYRGTVTLPGPCADWTMSYNLCCRNAAITNIDFPGSTQIYVYATLNNVITPCNNSPTFSNLPVPFVCLGQQYCYNHGAYDIDGDSLVYQVITPYDSPGLPVQYNGTFSPTNPLSSSPGMTFNTATGDICMTPTSLEITVMAVLVKEYRNGVLIGSVERDIQVTVIDCNNQLPALSGINGTNSFATSVCAGTQLCFNIQSSDPNAPQITTISWDQSIPDATFTVIPGNRPSANFCWTPKVSDISSNPYCFTVLVQDDNCPFLGSQVYSYCVTVRGLTVNAGPNVSVGCNSNSTITASASGGNGSYTYSWSNGASGPSISASPGTYIVTASDGTCSNKDTVQVLAGTNTPAAAFNMQYTCSSLDVQFSNQSTIVGGTISSYTWDFGDGNTISSTSPSHTYATVGTYQVMLIAQAVGGCLDTTIQTLNLVNDQPDALFNLNDACVGSQVNFSNQSVSTSTISSFSWDFGDATSSNVPSPAHVYSTVGNYNIKLVIVNANGCTDSITQPVTIFPLPIPDAGIPATICEGDTATFNGSGGGTYLWNPGNQTGSSISISPAQSMTFTLTVMDLNGCVAQDVVNVTVNQLPALNPMTDKSVCIGSSVLLDINAQANLTYVWSPGGPGTNQLTVSPASTTSYIVVLTNAAGCTNSDTVEVVVNPLPLVQGSSTDALCFGSYDGTASAQASSGTAPYNYWWSGGGGNSPVVTGLAAGNYTVNVTDDKGCTANTSVSIGQPTALIVQSTTSDALCFGASDGTASVSANGGTPAYTYLWNSGGQTTAAITGLSVGTYNVVVSDSNGCSQTFNLNINQPTAISLNISSTPAQCFGSTNGTASIIVSGGSPVYAYNWSNASGTVDNLSGLAAGNYSVTVTDAQSCTATASISVTQPSVLQLATSSTPASCSAIGNGSATVVVSGGMAGYSYSWSPFGGNNTTANSLTPGQYTSTVTDANGCTSTAVVNVASIGGPVISPTTQSNVSCFGGNNGSGAINVNAGTPPYTIAWSPSGGAAMQATNLSAGTYSVRVTDNSGCIATHQVIITQPSLLNSGINKTDVACYGMSTGSASVNVIGGTLPYSYNWSPGGLGPETANNLSAGNYSVLITDANGCTNSVATNIVQPTALVPVINSSQLRCHGDMNGTALVVVSGGVPAYNYSWSPGNATTSSLNGLGSGNYSVSITDAQGCVIVVSTSITEPAPMNLNLAGSTTICIGQSAQLSAFVSGGTSPYSYLWNTGETDSSHFVSPLIATSYSMQVVDSNGCSISSLPIAVNVYPPLTVVAADLNIICEGDNAQISSLASGGNGGPYTYSWNNGSIIGSGSAISPVGDSTFVVTVTDGCGTPAAKDSVSIIVHPLPQVAFLPQSIEGCTPVNALFTNYSIAPAGSSYLWTLGDNTTSTQTEPAHEYIDPGVYDVSLTIVSPEGCTEKLIVPQAVKVFGYPEAAFSQSSPEITVLNPGITFYDESIDADYWEWDFGDGTDPSFESNPVHEYPDSGTYIVRLIVHSPGGCADTTYSTVRVEMEFIINVPNAFSPNGDGVNDGFIAKGIGYTDYSMWILDRWGRKIYHSTDRAIAWDGTYFGNGNQCQADVYEWVLDVLDFRGKKHRLIGHVTLFR